MVAWWSTGGCLAAAGSRHAVVAAAAATVLAPLLSCCCCCAAVAAVEAGWGTVANATPAAFQWSESSSSSVPSTPDLMCSPASPLHPPAAAPQGQPTHVLLAMQRAGSPRCVCSAQGAVQVVVQDWRGLAA